MVRIIHQSQVFAYFERDHLTALMVDCPFFLRGTFLYTMHILKTADHRITKISCIYNCYYEIKVD